MDMLVVKMKGARLVNFGTVMLEEGLAKKWIKDRDELRKLPVERQRRLQTYAASKISHMKEPTVIVDTHLFIRTREGFWPGLPFEVVRAMKPTHLVLVEATPKEIASRRLADGSRYRDPVGEEALSSELELARSFVTVSSTLTGAPIFIVNNRDKKADEAAGEIASALEGSS